MGTPNDGETYCIEAPEAPKIEARNESPPAEEDDKIHKGSATKSELVAAASHTVSARGPGTHKPKSLCIAIGITAALRLDRHEVPTHVAQREEGVKSARLPNETRKAHNGNGERLRAHGDV